MRPVEVDELQIAVGETYDVRWEATAHGHRMNGKVTFDVK